MFSGNDGEYHGWGQNGSLTECVQCGTSIITMCWRGTGYCCDNCRKAHRRIYLEGEINETR